MRFFTALIQLFPSNLSYMDVLCQRWACRQAAKPLESKSPNSFFSKWLYIFLFLSLTPEATNLLWHCGFSVSSANEVFCPAGIVAAPGDVYTGWLADTHRQMDQIREQQLFELGLWPYGNGDSNLQTLTKLLIFKKPQRPLYLEFPYD